MKKFIALISAVLLMCVMLTSCGGNVYDGFYEHEDTATNYGEDAVFTIEIDGEEFEMVTKNSEMEFVYTGNCYQCGQNEIILEFTKCTYTLEGGTPVEQDVDDDEEDLHLNFTEDTLYNEDEELSFIKVDK